MPLISFENGKADPAPFQKRLWEWQNTSRRPHLSLLQEWANILDRPVGRIRLAHGRTGQSEGWDWSINVPLPIPSWGVGRTGSLDEARVDFRRAWERFYAALTPHDIQHWHHHQDAAEGPG